MELELGAELYVSFAAIFHRPSQALADNLEELIELWAEALPKSTAEIRTLLEFCHRFPSGEARLNALWEHYIPLFETGNVEAPPYASVHLGDDGLVWGQEAFEIRQFYAMSGFAVEDGGELPDHIAVELEFCSLLARNGELERLREFTVKHLTPFLKHILPRIKQTQRPVYAEVASLLEHIYTDLLKVGENVG